MRKLFACCLLGAMLLAGCKDANTEAELAATKARLADAEVRAQAAQEEADRARADAARLRSSAPEKLIPVETAANPAPKEAAPDPQVEKLKAEVAALEKKVAELEAEKAKQPTVEAKPAEPTPATPAQPDDAAAQAEAAKRVEALLPLVKSDSATGKQRDELLEQLFKADKPTRDRVIEDMKKWVNDEPANKHARMGLANALVSRFVDLKKDDFMGQATLAGQITDEAEKALELDPEFYEAVAFVALMKVEYPTFSPEFKGAHKDLDRALELQAKLTWEDRFAEIYVGYSMWYRKQGKLDEAAAKCQAGLDKAPRNDALIAEQKKVEDARKPATGE